MGGKRDENDRVNRALNKIVFRAYDAKYAEIYATVRSNRARCKQASSGEAFFLLCLVRGDLKYLIVAVCEDDSSKRVTDLD